MNDDILNVSYGLMVERALPWIIESGKALSLRMNGSFLKIIERISIACYAMVV